MQNNNPKSELEKIGTILGIIGGVVGTIGGILAIIKDLRWPGVLLIAASVAITGCIIWRGKILRWLKWLKAHLFVPVAVVLALFFIILAVRYGWHIWNYGYLELDSQITQVYITVDGKRKLYKDVKEIKLRAGEDYYIEYYIIEGDQTLVKDTTKKIRRYRSVCLP